MNEAVKLQNEVETEISDSSELEYAVSDVLGAQPRIPATSSSVTFLELGVDIGHRIEGRIPACWSCAPRTAPRNLENDGRKQGRRCSGSFR
jgi:hypothetical protein